MLGERAARAEGVRPYSVHGVPHVEVALRFDDGSVEVARLGAESVDPGLAPGDRVVVRSVMATVVEVRRADPDAG